MQAGGFQSQPLMRLTLGFTLFFLVAFTATNFAMYFSRMSLDPASVVTYYTGSEEDFHPARSYQSMLEVAHSHMAMMALVLLVLTHLLIFAPFEKRTKVVFIAGAFVCGILDEGGGWLVRFVDPSLAIVKVIGFVGLQGSLVFLLMNLTLFLYRGWQRAKEQERFMMENESMEDVAGEEEQLP